MMVKILFLGRLADEIGERELHTHLPSAIGDAGALRGWLGERFPALLDPSVRVIVNNVLAHNDETIAPDDEVAFFPPVSGG